ncbi:MAG: HAMP domain-containing histidine kinase [Deltaproteobacteria bacterium]|nr:HAMP domain-containing histidine kinase [Deltaproteobacteria bacterium]
MSGQIGADFYLAYLLTILLCGICKDFRGWITVTLLSPVVYGSFLLRSAERLDPVLYLRIPFPFVVALFYGYFVQIENSERTGKDRAEHEAQRVEAQEQIRRLLEQTKRQALDLEKSNRVKDEFLSTMSHVLRTPLNVIMGYADMIKDRILGPISDEQERSLEKVMVRCRDLLDMISGILQATSLEAEAVAAENRPVSLTELLSELRSAYEAPRAKEAVLVWDYPEDLPAIRTDKDRLKQILMQLIHNAVKFTPQGQVTISVRQVPGERIVEFKVSDTGIGIPQDALLLIFEKFRQVDSSETRTNGGVGLGLYIAKRLADLLGGTIHVESEPGKGSVFTVTLPY